MAEDLKVDTRRYVRALGPFNGYHLGLRKTPVLVFNLNLGGGFVNFKDEQPAGATLVLTIDLHPRMVYIFERQNEVIQVETRYANESKTFQIICRLADGTTTQESFGGEASFRSRLDEIRTGLERDAWHTAGPHLLAEGWKI